MRFSVHLWQKETSTVLGCNISNTTSVCENSSSELKSENMKSKSSNFALNPWAKWLMGLKRTHYLQTDVQQCEWMPLSICQKWRQLYSEISTHWSIPRHFCTNKFLKHCHSLAGFKKKKRHETTQSSEKDLPRRWTWCPDSGPNLGDGHSSEQMLYSEPLIFSYFSLQASKIWGQHCNISLCNEFFCEIVPWYLGLHKIKQRLCISPTQDKKKKTENFPESCPVDLHIWWWLKSMNENLYLWFHQSTKKRRELDLIPDWFCFYLSWLLLKSNHFG